MVFIKKTASKQTTAAPSAGNANVTMQNVTQEERARMVAEAAYYRAERRGFQAGNQESDWYEAEKEVEVILSRPPQKAARK